MYIYVHVYVCIYIHIYIYIYMYIKIGTAQVILSDHLLNNNNTPRLKPY